MSFAPAGFEVPVGQPVTVIYRNESGTPHDIAFYGGPDARSSRLGATGIVPGGASDEATFTAPAEPGTYYFHCDLHPIQMSGTYTVVA
jgi:plastocyanin